jgi:hypothetical protein
VAGFAGVRSFFFLFNPEVVAGGDQPAFEV